jgi:hypothetical protein
VDQLLPSTEVRTRDWEVLMRQTWCWAYVRNFSNAIETMRMGFPEIVGISVPQRVTAGQLNDVLTQWIIKHPADRMRTSMS